MSKIISLAILFLYFLFQFPTIVTGAEISPIGSIIVGDTKQVTVSSLEPTRLYYWSESGPSGFTEFTECYSADGAGVIQQTLGPYPITGEYTLIITFTPSDTTCAPFGSLPGGSQTFTVVNTATITDFGSLIVGEVKEVTVSGLAANKLYYWKESGPKTYEYCFRADGSGTLNQTLGPFDISGTYRLEIRPSLIDDEASCQSSVGSTIIDKTFTVSPTVGSICNPPRIPTTNTGANTCEYKKREGPRAIDGECPVGYYLTKNDCNAGSLPTLIRETTTFRCECVTEGTPICEPPSSCISNEECQAKAGCESWVCTGAASHTPGRCVNPATTCSKNTVTCASDADCRDGTDGCSKYYCWTIGHGKQCRYGPPLIPTPLPYNPVTAKGSQCGTLENPGFNTAIGCIPTNPDKLVKAVLTFVISISGGLAFLLMLLGAFQMLTSAGNPETLQAGRERFTQAIVGLLFVIFSVLLLQIIGVDILGLEGFRR